MEQSHWLVFGDIIPAVLPVVLCLTCALKAGPEEDEKPCSKQSTLFEYVLKSEPQLLTNQLPAGFLLQLISCEFHLSVSLVSDIWKTSVH